MTSFLCTTQQNEIATTLLTPQEDLDLPWGKRMNNQNTVATNYIIQVEVDEDLFIELADIADEQQAKKTYLHLCDKYAKESVHVTKRDSSFKSTEHYVTDWEM